MSPHSSPASPPPPSPTSPDRPRLWRYGSLGLMVTLGLTITLVTTVWVERWERISRQSQFQKQINNLTTALQRTTNRYTELLLSIGDLYAATDNRVDGGAFQQFVQRAVNTYPGIQALEWAPQISHGERATYERWLATQPQSPSPYITERAGEGNRLMPAAVRDRYVPVTFLEPLQNNELALGYDLASDATRRIALERARDTGAIAATGRIQLVQETADHQYSFLVFVPIYSGPALTPVARRQRLRGYILGVFRVADVVEEALADLDSDLDFYILDRTARPPEQLLGRYDAASQRVVSKGETVQLPPRSLLCPVAAACVETLQLGQREWQMVFIPPDPHPLRWAPLATLTIGLLLTAIALIAVTRWQDELRRTRELSELKLRLFSMASHELRTPLSVVTISAQALMAHGEEVPLAQQRPALDRIQLAAKRMGQLVEDMLTLSRAEAGKLEFNPAIVPLRPFCQQMVDQTQLQPGQTLTLSGDALDMQAYLDKKLMTSVLANLLSNGAKYSRENSPLDLRVTATATHFCFAVVDQGRGITEADQARMFDAFYRGSNAGQTSGVGLGLAVVKTCLDLHQGTLHVTSRLGQGTTVTACIPKVE
ncbi:MAG: CHASE domain-containing protein [Leptolyngbya sp.]|nr:CHASE domain-containing protein [Leptolyngbya sp.]